MYSMVGVGLKKTYTGEVQSFERRSVIEFLWFFTILIVILVIGFINILQRRGDVILVVEKIVTTICALKNVRCICCKSSTRGMIVIVINLDHLNRNSTTRSTCWLYIKWQPWLFW